MAVLACAMSLYRIANLMKLMRNPFQSLKLRALGLSLVILAVGCVKGPPTVNPTPADDPAGLGTPQERLKLLESNTTMSDRLKARRIQILKDEINKTNTAPH